MAEIDSLGTNFYYTGINASSEESVKNRKKQEIEKSKKTKFSQLIKNKTNIENQNQILVSQIEEKIQNLSIEDAAIYLSDCVNEAGNLLNENLSDENIEKFKVSVKQFIKFVVENNFEISSKKRNVRRKLAPSRLFYFSTYSNEPHAPNPRYQVQIINEKLNELTKSTLGNQMENLKILAKVDEIKGLIVDLMSS